MRILAPCLDFGGTIIEPLVNKNMRVGSRRFGSLVYVQWTSGIDYEPWPWDAWVRFLKKFPGATFLCCHSCLKLRYIFWAPNSITLDFLHKYTVFFRGYIDHKPAQWPVLWDTLPYYVTPEPPVPHIRPRPKHISVDRGICCRRNFQSLSMVRPWI